MLDGQQVVRNKEHGSARVVEALHLPQAFLLKIRISNGQHLIHQKHFRI